MKNKMNIFEERKLKEDIKLTLGTNMAEAKSEIEDGSYNVIMDRNVRYNTLKEAGS